MSKVTVNKHKGNSRKEIIQQKGNNEREKKIPVLCGLSKDARKREREK